jgi:ectoine hydroxylase-related dioxygenase (phytanoyl-CoA dioxygenase family)
VFFNPALMHGAGHNRSTDIYRMANLLQVSSTFGRAMEAMDRAAMSRALYAPLQSLVGHGTMSKPDAAAAIVACAEGYAFPTNLDTDPPVGGLAPKSQAAIMADALDSNTSPADFSAALDAWSARRNP